MRTLESSIDVEKWSLYRDHFKLWRCGKGALREQSIETLQPLCQLDCKVKAGGCGCTEGSSLYEEQRERRERIPLACFVAACQANDRNSWNFLRMRMRSLDANQSFYFSLPEAHMIAFMWLGILYCAFWTSLMVLVYRF